MKRRWTKRQREKLRKKEQDKDWLEVADLISASLKELREENQKKFRKKKPETKSGEVNEREENERRKLKRKENSNQRAS